MGNSFNRQFLLRFAVMITIVVVLVGLLYFFSRNVSATGTDIVQTRAQLDRYSGITQTLAQLSTQAPQAEQYAPLFNALLPTNEELLDFPDWMRTIANTNGLTLEFRFDGDSIPRQGTNPGHIRFSFSVAGDNNKVAAFLNDIEKQIPRFILSIDRFELTNGGTTYHLSGQGSVFFR